MCSAGAFPPPSIINAPVFLVGVFRCHLIPSGKDEPAPCASPYRCVTLILLRAVIRLRVTCISNMADGPGHVGAVTSGVLLLLVILIPALPLPYVTQAGNKAGHCPQPWGCYLPCSALAVDPPPLWFTGGGAAGPGSLLTAVNKLLK